MYVFFSIIFRGKISFCFSDNDGIKDEPHSKHEEPRKGNTLSNSSN